MSEHSLRTERLLLRRWRESDIAPFATICADPNVMRYTGAGDTRTSQQTAESIRAFEIEWEEKGYGLFAVELLQDEELIGFTGLSFPNFLPEILPSIEIGWRFSKHSWGKGYASEAARAVLGFGVSKLGLTDIVSICQKGNAASERIMQKLGMKFDRETTDPTCQRTVRVYRLPARE